MELPFDTGSDIWEKKTRAQYLQNNEAHRLYKIASDPSTPARELEAFAEAIPYYDPQSDSPQDELQIVLEGLAANPNTPPSLLAELIRRSSFACRAFCRNPITPFLLLEQPDFVATLQERGKHALLREAEAPPLFVELIAAGQATQNAAIQYEAQLHVAFAGEADTRGEWEQQLRDYWRAVCAATVDVEMRQWHTDLAEIGLAPEWAVGKVPLPEPVPSLAFSTYPPVSEWLRFAHKNGSPEAARLLKSIAPKVENQIVLAHGLRAKATPSDLRRVLHNPDCESGWVKETILRHPSADAAIISEVMEEGADARMVVCLPKTPPNVLADLLQNENPFLRRLARRHPNAPPNARRISRLSVFRLAQKNEARPSLFVSFVVCLNARNDLSTLPEKAEHWLWTERLEAVFLAPVSDACIPNDPGQRTGRDLLHHLSRDGNRIVRAVAQTRLADPAYRFTLDKRTDEQ